MEKEMNLTISRIRVEINHLQENSISLAGDKLVIFTIPDNIINELKDFNLPTIHMVLEVILFYSSYMGRTLEIEEMLHAYLEQYLDQEELYSLIQTVKRSELVDKIEESLSAVYDAIWGILFYGWTLKPGSIDFYNNYDILIRSEKGRSYADL